MTADEDPVFRDATLDPACDKQCDTPGCERKCDRLAEHPGRCICPRCWTNRKGPL